MSVRINQRYEKGLTLVVSRALRIGGKTVFPSLLTLQEVVFESANEQS